METDQVIYTPDDLNQFISQVPHAEELSGGVVEQQITAVLRGSVISVRYGDEEIATGNLDEKTDRRGCDFAAVVLEMVEAFGWSAVSDEDGGHDHQSDIEADVREFFDSLGTQAVDAVRAFIAESEES